MKRAGPRTLQQIAPLLAELRARPALRERRAGHFCIGSREFLHFHDDPAGVFADVRFAEEFVRMPVSSPSEQADLLAAIDDCLSSVEARATGKKRERARRHGRAG